MSNTDDTDAPASTDAPVSAATQAEFLATARARSMNPDPGAGPMVRCPRCRHEQRWDDMTKHIVMKEGDSAFRHCVREVCSSIFSLQEGRDAHVLFCSDRPAPEPDTPQDGPGPDGEKGCPEKESYETPSLTEINIGAADALIAHHAKELTLKLIRVADVVVDEIAKANSGGETRGLLDAIKYSLDLAGLADMLGDKAILRVPMFKSDGPSTTPDAADDASGRPVKCLSCGHLFEAVYSTGIISCPSCDSRQDCSQARENYRGS